MSLKFGKCPSCPAGSPEVRLYGSGVCAYHLNNPKDDQSKQKIVKTATVDEDKLLEKFYREQWELMPKYCENECGNRLLATTLGKAKFFICHIVPKKNFKSVMVHPDNRFFGCWQCHSDYDSKWTKAVMMPVWPLVIERFSGFMKLIKDTELKYLPDALRIIYDSTP